MNRENVSRFVYLLLGILCAANGLWLLLDPVNRHMILYLPADNIAADAMQASLMQQLGAAWILVGSALLWCAANPAVRARVHPALAVFFGLLATPEIVRMLAAQIPLQQWLAEAPLLFLSLLLLLVLVIMLLPMPRLPQRGERGVVKWFDAKKGFGFIVRSNGEEIFVHYRSIRGGGHRALKDGQAVRFRVGQGDKGLQAEEVVPA